MNIEDKVKIVKALKDLLITKDFPNTGICKVIKNLVCGESEGWFAYDLVKRISVSWEHFSGDPNYPVQSFNKKFNAQDYYWYSNNRWSGKYGNARKDLCRHIIKCLEKEIEDEISDRRKNP